MQTKSTPKVREKKSQEYRNNSETNRKPSVKVEHFVQLPCPQMDKFQPFEKSSTAKEDRSWWCLSTDANFPYHKVETATQAPFVTSKTIQNPYKTHTKPIKTTSYCAECWNRGAIIEWASQQVSDGSQLSQEMEVHSVYSLETRRLTTHGSSKMFAILHDSLLWSLHHLRLCVRLFMSGLALYIYIQWLHCGFKWACEGGVGRVSALQNPQFHNLA